MKARLEHKELEINGQYIPLKIYREARNNVRASMGKTAFILRMPFFIPANEEYKHLNWFKDWVKEIVNKREDVQAHFVGKSYQTGDKIQVGNRGYELHITYEDLKQHHARLKDGIIYLRLSRGDTSTHLNKSIRHLLSRVVAGDFLPEIERRIHELNRKYFQKNIKRVYLKYNQSNWGSCSSKSNINLSTRLLFAPQKVIDYVIIHELAHLIEMNHSPRFWKIVRDIMPDYKEQEQWLKKNGAKCDF
ncbi:MAG: M48 family metallopeptidase [Bacteroidota bacterium]